MRISGGLNKTEGAKMNDDDLLKLAITSLLSMGDPEQIKDRDLRAAAKAAQQLCAE